MNEELIFAVALEKQSAAERQAYLSEACGGNAELRAQVDELLRASDDAGSFLNHAPVSAGGTDATIAATRAGGDTEKSATWTGTLPFLDPCDKPDRIGKLGHYEIIEVVGYGGMGAVLRALDTKLSRVVAVKVMAPELAASLMAVKRFLREARTAASVHHDHVVTIHNVEETHSPPYLVMQYIDGQTLAQKIEREGALELAHILRIGSQVAAGLAAAHKHGLIHRDVKPANILLENGVERVKITDFGLARAADDMEMTQTGMIAGTPQYMSPEQAKGEPIDMRSDLFSLGSVLYSMCTGRAAFRADNTMGVLRRVCEDVPRPIREVNPEIPEWLAAIVSKLLAKNPADRFQTAAEVAELLSQHLAHVQSPTLVPRPATVVVPPPPVQPAIPFVMPAKMSPASPSGDGAVIAVVVVLAMFAILAPLVIAILLGIGLAVPLYQSRQRQPTPPMIAAPPKLTSPVAAPTVPSPQVNLLEWGKFLDPVGNCQVKRRTNQVEFLLPGSNHYHLIPTAAGGMNAPRLLRDAQGDFLIQVRVLPFAKSLPDTSTAGAQTPSWRSAGLVVIGDEQTVVRLERVSWGEKKAGGPMAHSEWFAGGQRNRDFYGQLTDDERWTMLQIERRGSQLHLRYSDDGSKWEDWQTITDVVLPDRVLVGLVAMHTTPTEFDPCFEDVQFRDAATTENLSVAAQNPDFPPESSPGQQTAEFVWGPVRDGWQIGVGWKGGTTRYTPDEPVEFELKVRNATDPELTVETKKPDDWDVWYSGGDELHLRIFGSEKQSLTLGPREERLIEVPDAKFTLTGLVKNFYKVRVTTPLGDKSQQPPVGRLGFQFDGPEGAARHEALKHPEEAYAGVAWGEPVFGLSFGLRATGKDDREPEFEFFLWNVTSGSVGVEYLEHHPLDWQLVLRDREEKEYRSAAILTGPKVQTGGSVAAGAVRSLGSAPLPRQWSTADGPRKLPGGHYTAASHFDCQPTGYSKLHLRLTSGVAPVEVK